MLARCYSERSLRQYPSYRGCVVCGRWHYFSSFYLFCAENYRDGYSLDKDILSPRKEKMYGPETCCFIPPEINNLLTNDRRRRGELPVGVQKNKNPGSACPFVSEMKKYGAKVRIGLFVTAESAFLAYKEAKEAHIKDVAHKYFDSGKITKRVYDALMRYEIEITD